MMTDLSASESASGGDDVDCKLVISGASYAAGWQIPELAGCQVINSGRGGVETSDMLSNFDVDVVAHNPDYVLIWGFINDIFRADTARVLEKLSMAQENIKALVQRTHSIGARPILATEITIGFPDGFVNLLVRWKNMLLGKQTYQAYVNGHVVDLNRWLVDYANEANYPLLDLKSVLTGENDIRKDKYVQHDGSHVTEAGYDALTDYARLQENDGGVLKALDR